MEPENPKNENVIFTFFTNLSDYKLVKAIKNLQWFFYLIFATIFGLISFFSTPDLLVKYDYIKLLTPINTVKEYENINSNLYFNTIISQQMPNLKKFIRSPQLLTIILKNNSFKKIDGIDLKIKNVIAVNDIAFKTDSIALRRKTQNLTINHFIEHDNTKFLAFPELNYIPPKTTIGIQIWGKFNTMTFTPNFYVTSSSKSVRIIKMQTLSGVPAIILKNLFPIFIIVLFGIFIIACQKFTKKQ